MCTEHAQTGGVCEHVPPENVWNLDVQRLLLTPFLEQNSSRMTNVHIDMNIYFPAHCALQQALVLAS